MKRSALFVGVNRYEDPEINPLQFAEADATELYGFFKHKAGYDDVRHLLNPDNDTILDTASDMLSRLGQDDLFLFFFAGHGVEHEGRHLLLCPQARYSRLKFLQHVVPLDLFKQETARAGLNRVLILDACRTDLLKGQRGSGTGLRDVQCLRKMVAATSGSQGSLAILCSCDEGQQSRELPQIGQGLFSRALLDMFESSEHGRLPLSLGDEFEKRLVTGMLNLARGSGIGVSQRPWMQKSGDMPDILACSEPQSVNSLFPNAGKPRSAKRAATPNRGNRTSTLDAIPNCALNVSIPDELPSEKRMQPAPEESWASLEAHEMRPDWVAASHRQKDYSYSQKLPVEAMSTTGIRFRLIPPGEFTMGSDEGDDSQRPAHKVSITRRFWIGRFPVTQKEWSRVMGRNPSRSCRWVWNFENIRSKFMIAFFSFFYIASQLDTFSADLQGAENVFLFFLVLSIGLDVHEYISRSPKSLPVNSVSWDACQIFMQKLCLMEGVPDGTYRLPTEAEWEYACKAGSCLDACVDVGAKNQVMPIKTKKANAWGLSSMLGNVGQWCMDWRSDFRSDSVSDTCVAERSEQGRCVRGRGNHPAERGAEQPEKRSKVCGLRLVRVCD